MVSYKINEDIYDLPEDKVESFLIKFPDAKKLDEPGKTTPTAPGAVVEETTAPNTDSKLENSLLALQKKVDALDPTDNSREAIRLRRRLKKLGGDKPIAEIPLEEVTVVGRAKPGVKGPMKESITVEGIDKKIVDFLPKYKEAISDDNIDKNLLKETVANKYFDLSKLNRPVITDPNKFPEYKNDRETDILNYFGEKKYKEYQNYLETGNLPTTEIIQNYTNEELFNIKNQNAEIALRNVDEDVRKSFRTVVKTDADLLQSLQSQQKDLQYTDKIISNKKSKLQKQYEPYKQKVQNIISKIKEIAGDDLRVDALDSPVRIEQYNNLVNELRKEEANIIDTGLTEAFKTLQNEVDAHNFAIQKYNNETKNLEFKTPENFAIAQRTANLNYKFSKRLGLELERFFLGNGYEFLGLTADVANELTKLDPIRFLSTGGKIAEKGWFDKSVKQLRESSFNYSERISNDIETKLPQSLTTDDISRDDVSVFDWGVDALANNSGSILTALVPGTAALKGASTINKIRAMRAAQATFFTTSTGAKSFELEKQQLTAPQKLDLIDQQLSSTEDPQQRLQLQLQREDVLRQSNYNKAQKAFTSYSFGTIELAAETLGTLRWVQDINKLNKYKGGNWFKQGWRNIVVPYGKGVGIELPEEFLTQVGHNLADQIILQENKSIFSGIDKDFVANTVFTSLAISSPKVGSNTYDLLSNTLKTKQEIAKNRELADEIIELQTIKPLVKGDQLNTVKARINEILDEMAIGEALSMHKFARMNNEDIFQAAELKRKISNKRKQLATLGREGQVSFEARTIKNKLIEEVSDLENQYEKLIKNKKNDQIISKLKENDLYKSQEDQAKFDYLSNLYAFFSDAAIFSADKNTKVNFLRTEEDFENFKKELPVKKLNDLQKNYGTVHNGNIYVNENLALKGILQGDEFAAVTALHELFHIKNGSKLKDSKLDISEKAAVDSAINILNAKKQLGEISVENHDKIINRLNTYKKEGGNFVYEELMNVLNEASLLGMLDINDFDAAFEIKNFINNLGENLLGKEAGWIFKLKDGEAVLNFIKNYQRKALSGQTIQATPEEEETLKLSLGFEMEAMKPDERKKFVNNILQQNKNDWNKEWLETDKGRAELGKVISKFVPVMRSVAISRPSMLETATFENKAEAIEDAVFEGIVVLTKHAKNFNPDIQTDLDAWINSYVTQKYLTGVKQIKKEQFDVKIDKENFDLAEDSGMDEIIPENINEIVPSKIQRNLKVNGEEILAENTELAGMIRQLAFDMVDEVISEGILPSDAKFKDRLLDKIKLAIIVPSRRKEDKESKSEFVFDEFKKKLNVGRKNNYESVIRENFDTVILNPKILNNSYFVQAEREIPSENKIFTKNPRRLTKQADIRKAVQSGKAYVDNEAQGVFLYDRTRINVNEGSKFFLAGDRIDGRKRSLQMALFATAVVDAIPQAIQSVNKETKKNVFNLTEADIRKAIDKLQRDPNTRLSISSVESLLDRPLFELEQRVIDAVLLNNNVGKTFDLKTEEGREGFVLFIEKSLLPLMPKYFWFGTKETDFGTAFTASNANYGLSMKNTAEAAIYNDLREKIKSLRDKPGIKFGDNIPGVEDFSVSSYSTIFKNSETIEQNIKNGTIDKWNKKVARIHRAMWSRFNNAIRKNKKLAGGIGTYLKLVGNDTNHWHKLGAQFAGYSKELLGSRFEYEHAMPATAAYLYLMNASLSGANFEAAYDAVIANYKLIALDKAMDDKLRNARTASGYSLQRRMPDEWKLLENMWYERYFNNIVAKIDGGIDPNSIIHLSGKTFAQEFDITNEGKKSDIRLSISPEQLNLDFNNILEQKTGIKSIKGFKGVKGKVKGRQVPRGIMDFFIPPTAEDLNGLMYALLPKSKAGDEAKEFIRRHIFRPYGIAIENITRERMALMNDFKALKKQLKNVPKTLKEKVLDNNFTKEDAVRVFIWTRQGMEIPGIAKKDAKDLLDIVRKDKDLSEFATQLININKGDGYVKPDNNWVAGTITTDLMQNINEVKRKRHLAKWKENIDAIFDEPTMNKLEAAFGSKYVKALKDILRRMESGRNRLPGGNEQVDDWLDWLNNSVGAIMFLNVRSAVLQTISSVNYINWSDNNPLKAAQAFANQKQYWSDFAMIFNSDYLQERRGGLKLNVSESEIADMANKGGVKGVIAYLLNKGFVLTRSADSFAIATGGAAMYRNRVNSYIKEGLSQKEAETKAFQDFRELTEEAQQSSRPDKISQEQASGFGRVILAFANTPMQYTRLMKRSMQDFIAGRGDRRTHLSKFMYYGFIQNFIFNALQQALFALGFDSEEEEEKIKQRYISISNSMLDSILRGTGVYGNAAMVIKNFAIDIAQRSQRPKPNYSDAAWRLLDISPPLDSKLTKIRSALYTLEYEGDKMLDAGLNLDNPAAMASAQTISAFTNVPLDRVMRLYDNIRGAVAEDTEAWQRVALLLGWSTWELGMQKPERKLTTGGVKKRKKFSKTKTLKLK